MTTHFRKFASLFAGMLLFFQVGCNASSGPQPPAAGLRSATSTPTPTPEGETYSLTPEVAVPLPDQAVIEISFRDALLGETCEFNLPVTIQQDEDQNSVSGETEATCNLSALQCGEACITMNSDWELSVSFTGSVTTGSENSPSGNIHGDFSLSGNLKNYASEWPEGSIPAFTVDQPFIVEQPGMILPLVLKLEEGASTQISPPSGGEPMIFVLHLGSP
jgi:hypothetical protein